MPGCTAKNSHSERPEAETDIETKEPRVQKLADSSRLGMKEFCDGLLMSVTGRFGGSFIMHKKPSPIRNPVYHPQSSGRAITEYTAK